MRRGVKCTAAIALLAGCGTSILVSYPAHEPGLRAHGDAVAWTRPLEDPVRITVAQIEVAPFRVTCQRTTVVTRSERMVVSEFGGIGRLVCGFMAVSEGTLAAALWQAGGKGSEIAGSLLVVDAVGALAYAIFARSSVEARIERGTGWTDVAQTCEPGLIVRAGEQSWTIGVDGTLEGDARALASAAVAGTPIAIAGGGSEVAWTPDARERCALIAQFSLDDPSGACVQPADVAATTRVGVPLEFRIRVHLPR